MLWLLNIISKPFICSDNETELVEKEREKAEKINGNLRRQLQDYIVPEVTIYKNFV